MSNMLKNFYGTSHMGYKRNRNEDRYLIKLLQGDRAILLGVADGMGGEPGGDISAQIVMDILQQYQPPAKTTEKGLADILEKAGKKIRRRAQEKTELEGMGTTATLSFVTNGTAYWAHVGDSRLYLGLPEKVTPHHIGLKNDFFANGHRIQPEYSAGKKAKKEWR
jgi:protein phosphatase